MNDFWKWMELKKYGEREQVGNSEVFFLFKHRDYSNFTTSIKPTKHMLIGYMMEYLREIKGKIILNIGNGATVYDIYDRYVKDILKAERERLWKG